MTNWQYPSVSYMFNHHVTGFLGQLTQAIRNFAKNLEGWLKNALVGAPEDVMRIKASDGWLCDISNYM